MDKQQQNHTHKILLGVNIDHVATLRNARGTVYPDPLEAAAAATAAGADSITIHLREDRRHIKDQDVIDLKRALTIPMNLEMAVTDEIIAIAEKIQPAYVCFVPEKREELTTEGGLDVVTHYDSIHVACQKLAKASVRVSLFIDPDSAQIDAAQQCGAPAIELHTGLYADASTAQRAQMELKRIQQAAAYAETQGLIVNAGHGLNIDNVKPIAAILPIKELNIGHAIIARAVFIGMQAAVQEMQTLMTQARASI